MQVDGDTAALVAGYKKLSIIIGQPKWIIMKNKTIPFLLISVLELTCSFAQGIDLTGLPAKLIKDPNEISAQTREFNHTFEQIGLEGHLVSCKILVEQPVPPRNTASGAICSWKREVQTRDVMVCDDEMIGSLTIRMYGFAESEEEVKNFVENNCITSG